LIKSDLASELSPGNRSIIDEQISVSHLVVDKKLSKKINKPIGSYVTVESDVVRNGNQPLFDRVSDALGCELNKLLDKTKGDVLVVGLGNRLLTADALGSKVCDRIIVDKEGGRRVRSLCPGVYGSTAIESYDVIRGVVGVVNPGVIIAVDSLCAARACRIGSAFQLTDVGIIPGSGVKNARKALNFESLGVPVISLGVPTVVYASTIAEESGGEVNSELSDMVVTSKDVDILVDACAEVISAAINKGIR